jgi:hypothetical protein
MHNAILFAGCLLPAFSQVVVQRNQIVLRVGSACALTTVSSTLTGRTRDGASTVVTGSTQFNYRLRTSRNGGSAEILQVFDPPSSGGSAEITYTVSPLPGASVRNNTTTTAGVPAPVAQFGANAHTTRAGEPGQIFWTWRTSNAAAVESPSPKLTITCR